MGSLIAPKEAADGVRVLSTAMICASLNLHFFASVSCGDGLSLKIWDQEGGWSRCMTLSSLAARSNAPTVSLPAVAT